MNTPRMALMLAVLAASSAASAQSVNPDKDYATFFAYNPTTSVATRGTLPQAGDVSNDGLYVYSATDRGWVHRNHSYVLVAGKWEHSANCLAYNSPNPVSKVVPTSGRGA